jgi:hypothetical protein
MKDVNGVLRRRKMAWENQRINGLGLGRELVGSSEDCCLGSP